MGGGPAGLYFAMLAKRGDPRHEITVFERNRPDDTFGFGVVFSEKTMNYLREHDVSTYEEILAGSYAWDPIEVRIHGRILRCGGIGFWAISRKRLLGILQRGAAKEGVDLRFQAEIRDPEAVAAEADLVAVSDGVNSAIRTHWAEAFRPTVSVGRTVFAWYGAAVRFPNFTFLFEENEAGRFCAHIYPYEDDLSTFIVEMDPETWRRAGLEESNRAALAPGASDQFGLEYMERLFAAHLEGRHLLGNNSKWAAFRTVRSVSWHHRNLVLMGDAAHTAHFSVGSGTKMAMEDAIALAFALTQNGADLGATFAAYEAERRPRVEGIQRASGPSLRWYEQFRHYWSFPAPRFAFHFLTRSNFDYGQLKERDPGFVAEVVSEVGALPGRVIPAAALTELVAVTAAGRFSPSTPVVVSAPSGRSILRLGHAGRRGAARVEGRDLPLRAGGWPLVAASAIPYTARSVVPIELDEAGMALVSDGFVSAAREGSERGYDAVLLDFAGGGLVAGFMSPLSNHRTDQFGGPLENRLRFALAIVAAVRPAITARLWIAISASDWLEGGFDDDEAVAAARALLALGVDTIVVRSGHATAQAIPYYGRCYNAAFSDRVRNEAGADTIVAGGILSLDDARNVLLAGRADGVLADPGFR
ncbi:MAG: bifunctional salicylyl-CoA 5-hydroxylase/oxidoreductase [Candidatus Dormibacteraceae bacterium]